MQSLSAIEMFNATHNSKKDGFSEDVQDAIVSHSEDIVANQSLQSCSVSIPCSVSSKATVSTLLTIVSHSEDICCRVSTLLS